MIQHTVLDKWTSKWMVILTEYMTYTFLQETAMYGKEIYDFLVKHISLDVKKATLYAILNKGEEQSILEITKMVENETTRGTARKYYQLTETGKQVVAAMEQKLSILDHITELKVEVNHS